MVYSWLHIFYGDEKGDVDKRNGECLQEKKEQTRGREGEIES